MSNSNYPNHMPPGLARYEKRPSLWSQIGGHPLLIAIVGGFFTIAGVVITVVWQNNDGSSEANRVTALEERVSTLTAERDKLAALVQELERAASNPAQVSDIQEFAVPDGAFVGIMDKNYILSVEEIRSGIATLILKNMDGTEDKHFMRDGGYITLRPKNLQCVLAVGKIDARAITVRTECRPNGS